MYAWPGYDGISPFLAHFKLAPVALSHVYSGSGTLANKESLIVPNGAAEFAVNIGSEPVSPAVPPQIMLNSVVRSMGGLSSSPIPIRF